MLNFMLAHPWIIILILLWTIPWKGAALWRAARRAHPGWFIALLLLNTFAILEILYLFIFSNWKKKIVNPKKISADKTKSSKGPKLNIL